MTRRLATILTCAITLSGQQTSTSIAIVDAVVTDGAGRPVTSLTPADFEITEDGKARAVARLTAFDTVRHTAATAGELPALELTPDQIHRTIVIVVDDLCLQVEGVQEARRRLNRMVETQLVPGDRVAILRTSAGTARQRQLNSDPRQIALAINAIEYLGGTTSHNSCAGAAWTTVSYALNGLKSLEGRKALVLMSGDLPAPGGLAGREIAQLAAQSATAIYQASAAAPMLSEATGGAAGVDLDRAVEEQRTFYALAFAGGGGRELAVKLRRPGLILRTRTAAIGRPPRFDFPAPRTPSDLLQEAMNSPFAGSAIGVTLTALSSNTQKEGPVVEALLHIDARDLSYVRDAKGKYHVDFDLNVAGILEAGQLALPATRPHAMEFTEEEYRRVAVEGLLYTLHLTAGSAASRQIRAVVTDARAGRMGAASSFVEVHDLAKRGFFLSGIVLQGASASLKDSPARRVFRPGQTLNFLYSVYNAASGPEGRAQIETQTRIFAGGREVFTGQPAMLSFDPSPDTQRRQVNGRLTLDRTTGTGRYVLVVNVADKLSKETRVAGQYIDFTVEQ